MGAPDILFRGGRVYTADPSRPWADAVAVADGEILAVGSGSDLDDSIGPRTRVVDLSGGMLLPGLIDSHTHYIVGPSSIQGVDLTDVETIEELEARLQDVAAAGGDGVVSGFGWRSTLFPDGPDRRILDRVFGARPTLLHDISGHSVWCNTAALEAAGVLPDGGRAHAFGSVVVDEGGEPTGWLLEDAAIEVSGRLAPLDASRLRKDLEAFLPRYSQAGLTTVYDAGIFGIGEEGAFGVLADLERNGKLPQRVIGSHVANHDPTDPVATLLRLRERTGGSLHRASVLKIFVDGVPENHTSAYLEPYADRPGEAGSLAIEPSELEDLVVRADAAGLDCHFHALGDRAVRAALDAVEAAVRTNGGRDRRHTICHAHIVDQEDVPRFRRLGVVYQTSPHWIALDPFHPVIERRLGERASRRFRCGHSLTKASS